MIKNLSSTDVNIDLATSAFHLLCVSLALCLQLKALRSSKFIAVFKLQSSESEQTQTFIDFDKSLDTFTESKKPDASTTAVPLGSTVETIANKSERLC